MLGNIMTASANHADLESVGAIAGMRGDPSARDERQQR
jgi:hypothetical protein